MKKSEGQALRDNIKELMEANDHLSIALREMLDLVSSYVRGETSWTEEGLKVRLDEVREVLSKYGS